MVKVISLSDEAYTELKRVKEGESFSGAILRLLKETKKNTNYAALKKLAGAFKEDREEWEEIKKGIYEHRAEAKVRKWSF